MNVYEQIKRQRLGQSYSLNYDLFALNNEKTLYQRDVKGHTGCVNAVEFNKDGNLIASGMFPFLTYVIQILVFQEEMIYVYLYGMPKMYILDLNHSLCK